MSRVGNKIINVPEGVKVEIAADNTASLRHKQPLRWLVPLQNALSA